MKNKQINFRTTQENFTAIANAAKQMDTSISKLLIRAFWYYCAAMHIEPSRWHNEPGPKPRAAFALSDTIETIANAKWIQED